MSTLRFSIYGSFCPLPPSLFQALGQWGRWKKRVREEWDLVKKIGEGAFLRPPLFFLTDPARPAPAFSIVPTE